jgi:hypothetical protein
MKATNRPAPAFECENLNSRRYYVEGASVKPNGDIIGWTDWKRELSHCAEMLTTGPEGWRFRITDIWDDQEKVWISDESQEWQAACLAAGMTHQASFAI